MTVRELLRAIWTARWFVVVAVVVVVAAAYVYAEHQVITYRAAVTVQLGTIDDKVASAAGVQALVAPDMSAVTAPDLLKKAAQQPGVSAAGLVDRVQASFDSGSHTVSIAADAPTVAGATATADAVANAYVAAVPDEIQAQLDAIAKQVTILQTQLTTAQQTLAKKPGDQFANADITSAVAQYQALSAARSAYQQVATPAKLVAPASTAIPLGLGPSAIVALGVLAGLVVGLGAAMAHRGLSNRLRTAAEAARIAKAPVIAELEDVPRAVRTFRVRGLLPVAGRAATPYTESIRELRTALRQSLSQRSHAVVVVTATDTAAPRAFIAANLAASWALSGRRAVVVSGDMRRPEMADLLPLASGQTAEPGAPRATLVPNLSVVPVPDSPLDPADYLATDEVRARIEELRADADIVVVDAPPVLAAADATILGTYADGAVLVATVDKSDRTTLEAASERLRTSGVTLFGVVLSGVRGSRRNSYASYGSDAAPTTVRHAATPARAQRPAGAGAPAGGTEAAAVEESSSAPPREAGDSWQPGEPAAAPLRTARSRPAPPLPSGDDEPIPVPKAFPGTAEPKPAADDALEGVVQDDDAADDERVTASSPVPQGNARA